jgi:hypothetical protein
MHLLPDPGKGSSDPPLTHCLPESSTVAQTEDCVEYSLPNPTAAGLFSSQFYWLRGFFVTPADAIGQGPQLLHADAGDILGLQVRVYNYSLVDMNVGRIRVDFYAQEWDSGCNKPAGYYNHNQSCPGDIPCQDSCEACCIANAPVDSTYIGQDVIEPLPGFNSPQFPGVPNWELASTTFDTGAPSLCGTDGCGGKDFLFWVVIWPETGDASDPQLRDELPDHGLTRIPPMLKSIGDICPLDNDCVNGTCRATRTSCTADSDCESNTCGSHAKCTVSGVACASDADCDECLCDICMGRFSNNVGFYHQPIAIDPVTTEASLTIASKDTDGAGAGILPGDVGIERISVTPATAGIGEQVIVRAGLRAIGARVDGQLVRFRAVPPDAADLSLEEAVEQVKTFDQEILARIPAERVHEAEVPFFPSQLGTYRMLVSGVVRGEERLLGTTELEVVETSPTPTIPVPVATPTIIVVGVDDDGCAISPAGGSSSKGVVLLLFFALLSALPRMARAGFSKRTG